MNYSHEYSIYFHKLNKDIDTIASVGYSRFIKTALVKSHQLQVQRWFLFSSQDKLENGGIFCFNSPFFSDVDLLGPGEEGARRTRRNTRPIFVWQDFSSPRALIRPVQSILIRNPTYTSAVFVFVSVHKQCSCLCLLLKPYLELLLNMSSFLLFDERV